MSRFARASPWLRQLFTPAHTTQPNPGLVSDEVSLVQPYDGGGLVFSDPGEWAVEQASAVGVGSGVVILTAGSKEIVRILSCAAIMTAATPADCRFQVQNVVSNINVIISEARNVSSSGAYVGFQMYCPILGPTHVLRGIHENGGAATQITYRVYFVRAPLGSVFYI